MNIQKKLQALIYIVFISFTWIPTSSEAALQDRGGGLIYDDVLNITWLQDANYAKTSGYSPTGVFTSSQAISWAENLVYHDPIRNIDLSDWRLPTVSPIGVGWDYAFSTDGSTDWGPNNTNPANELSYMYFVNLGLKSFINPDGSSNPNFGIFGDGTVSGQANITAGGVTINNLQATSYWSGTRWLVPDSGVYYFTFVTGYGETNAAYEYTAQYAWAVRDGDVASVPEPQSYTMVIAGLGLIGFMLRRKKIRPS